MGTRLRQTMRVPGVTKHYVSTGIHLFLLAIFLFGSSTSTIVLLVRQKVAAAPALSFSDLGTHPQAAAQSTAAGNKLNTLSVFDGKVLAAYGDYDTNTGPITINPFDIASSTFDGSALSVASEQLDNWKVIDNKLYTTTIDPSCSNTCAAGYAVYTPGSGWEMKTPVSAEHIFDIETLTGTDIWLFGSSGGDTATAWRSTDGGANFSVVRSHTTNPGANNDERYYWGQALDGKMYLQAQLLGATSALQIYDGTSNTWSEGPTTAICSAVDDSLLSGPGPTVFAGNIICPRTNGIEVFDGASLINKTSSQQFPNFIPSCNTATGDIMVYEDMLYLLCGNSRTIMKSSALMRQWANIGTAPTGAKSFAVDPVNQMLYVGTTGSKLYRSSLLQDTVDPTIALDAPADGMVFHESHIYAAAEAEDDEITEKVEFYLGDTLLSTDDEAPYTINWENSWTAGVADVPPGEYSLTARAYDITGNTATSDPVSVELVSDGSINTVYEQNNVEYRGLAVEGDHTWSISYTKTDDHYVIGVAKVGSDSGEIEYFNSAVTNTYGAADEAFLPGTPLALTPNGSLWFSHCDTSTTTLKMLSFDIDSELFTTIPTEQPCGSTDATFARSDGSVWNISDFGAMAIDTDHNLSYITLSEDKAVLGSTVDGDGNLIVQLVDYDTYASQIATFDLAGNITDSYDLPDSTLGYNLAVNPANDHLFLGNVFGSDGEINEFTPSGELVNVYNVGETGETVYSVQLSDDSIWYTVSNDTDSRFDRVGRINLTNDQTLSRARLDQSSFSTFATGSDGTSMWVVNGLSRLIRFHDYVPPEDNNPPNDTIDTDNDGITDSIEDAGPNSGDANNDGTPDSMQANVTSLKYDETNYLVVKTSCASNFNVQNGFESSEHNDPAYDYPAGLVAFVGLSCGDPGSVVDIDLFYYGSFNSSSLTLRKWHDAIYSTIQGTTLNTITIDDQPALHAHYKITDGGELDQDRLADGNIVDPVGLGISVLGSPNTGKSQHWLLGLK